MLTSLAPAAADAAAVLELYRLRWPIACAFKRLKSLLHRDALRAFDPQRAQTYLLAQWRGPSWGMRPGRRTPIVSPAASRSARMSSAVWRITPRTWADLRRAVQGVVSLEDEQPGRRAWTDPLHERPRLRILQREAIFSVSACGDVGTPL